jgi:hypothetical protein
MCLFCFYDKIRKAFALVAAGFCRKKLRELILQLLNVNYSIVNYLKVLKIKSTDLV